MVFLHSHFSKEKEYHFPKDIVLENDPLIDKINETGISTLQSPPHSDSSCYSASSDKNFSEHYFLPLIHHSDEALFSSYEDDSTSVDDQLMSDDESDDGLENSKKCIVKESLMEKVQALQIHYKNWSKTYNEFGGLFFYFLAACGYLSNNKDNIINLVGSNFIRSKIFTRITEFEDRLNKFDNTYKWLDCAIPLFFHSIKHGFIDQYLTQLEQLKLSCSNLQETVQKKTLSSLSEEKIRTKKIIPQLQNELEEDSRSAQDKASSKLFRLGIKVLSVVSASHSILHIKTAEKIGKCVYEFFRKILGLWDCYLTHDIQKEWLFHLQTPFSVNISRENSNPTEDEDDDYFESQEYDRTKLFKSMDTFSSFLHHCKEIKEVQTKFKELELDFEIPSTIEQFKQLLTNERFVRDFFQNYYYQIGCRVAMDKAQINSNLKKRKNEYDRKIQRSIPFINQQIAECQNKSIEEIQDHFVELNIPLHLITIPQNHEDEDHLSIPPSTKIEWEEATQNEEFVKALAGHWIDFQETTAQLAMQAMRQALLSKHQVERKFLSLQTFEYGIGLLSTGIQFALCNQEIKSFGICAAIEILITDIAKLGFPILGIFYVGSPLYPEVKFKIEAIFTLVFRHFFAISYKPNEYSVQSYQLTLQIRMIRFKFLIYSLNFLLQQGLLWINIRLVENYIQQMNHANFSEDQRSIDLTKKNDEYNLNCKKRIQSLQKNLEDLKIKDAKLIIQPQSDKKDHNGDLSDPIENLANAIEKADIDYFPPLVIEFFENHAGFKLTNKTKTKFQKHLEDFFSRNDRDFLLSYSCRHFAYFHG